MKKSSYVLIFLFFIFPPFGLVYYFLYGSQSLKIRAIFGIFTVVIVYFMSPYVSDGINLYHNKMWLKMSKRLHSAFRYNESTDFYKKINPNKGLESLSHKMTLFQKEMDLSLPQKEKYPFQSLLDISLIYYKEIQSKSNLKSVVLSEVLDPFLIDLEMSKTGASEKSFYRGIYRDYSLYLDLLEFSILLNQDVKSVDTLLNQVLSLRAEIASSYELFRLQNLLMTYFLLYNPSKIKSHSKFISEIGDYASQSQYNFLAYYTRASFYFLNKNYELALNDFLQIFKYQTKYYDVYQKIKLCLTELNRLKEMQVIDDYSLSEDLRFSYAKIDESLKLSKKILKSKFKVYSKLMVENLHNRGHILKNLSKDYVQARKHFQKILKVDEKERKEEAYFNLIMIELNTKNFKACEKYIAQLNEEYPMTSYKTKTNFIDLYLSIMKTIQ
ncbi:MAG: hypothetical protein COB02_03280 [Candidatus Cloacimonadota bacterium]|nr:MAG: hypothetical protein COB02_03280 [Candidatus Cloacimonadota bacterium]